MLHLVYPIVQLLALGLTADPSRFGRVVFLKFRGATIAMLVGGKEMKHLVRSFSSQAPASLDTISEYLRGDDADS